MHAEQNNKGEDNSDNGLNVCNLKIKGQIKSNFCCEEL